LLVVTPAGRTRLRRWLATRWARPWEPEPAPSVYGDGRIARVVLRTWALLPQPVRDVLTPEVYFITAGWSEVAWTSRPLNTGTRCPIVITGDEADAIARLVRHETAHRWLANPDLEGHGASVAEYEQVLAHARREGWPVQAADARHDEEHRLVRVLTLAWS
jgi:hypothetical protein